VVFNFHKTFVLSLIIKELYAGETLSIISEKVVGTEYIRSRAIRGLNCSLLNGSIAQVQQSTVDHDALQTINSGLAADIYCGVGSNKGKMPIGDPAY